MKQRFSLNVFGRVCVPLYLSRYNLSFSFGNRLVLPLIVWLCTISVDYSVLHGIRMSTRSMHWLAALICNLWHVLRHRVYIVEFAFNLYFYRWCCVNFDGRREKSGKKRKLDKKRKTNKKSTIFEGTLNFWTRVAGIKWFSC